MKTHCLIIVIISLFLQFVNTLNKEISGIIAYSNSNVLNSIPLSRIPNLNNKFSDKNRHYSVNVALNCMYQCFSHKLSENRTTAIENNTLTDLKLPVVNMVAKSCLKRTINWLSTKVKYEL